MTETSPASAISIETSWSTSGFVKNQGRRPFARRNGCAGGGTGAAEVFRDAVFLPADFPEERLFAVAFLVLAVFLAGAFVVVVHFARAFRCAIS
jgi:hypothetical protein